MGILGGALLFVPRLQATGIEEAVRWLPSSKAGKDDPPPQILQAPEFFFELEVKRIAAELHPEIKAIPPESVNDGKDFSKQTTEADLNDFAEALKTGAIQPPDVKRAETAHRQARVQLSPPPPPENSQNSSAGSDASPAATPAPAPEPAAEGAAPAEEFPSEFTDYHRGAFAFADGEYEKAAEAWNALLARPASERKYRTVWALFMLGKIAIEKENWDDARAWMGKVREAVKDKFADSLGLAAASFGWEAMAYLKQENIIEATKLYFMQLATGDTTAVLSLRLVLEMIYDAGKLDEFAAEPVLQRLITAAALSQKGPFVQFGETSEAATAWIAALEKAGAKNVKDADSVAWIYYQQGDYSKSKQWLDRANPGAPLVLWLKGKFALRDGKLPLATKLIGEAMRTLPVSDGLEFLTREDALPMPQDVAKIELGLLQLNRGEFILALKTLLASNSAESDAMYVAEGVLTIEELKAFITKEYPEPPKSDQPPPPAQNSDNYPPGPNYSQAGRMREELIDILICRLVRAGRYDEAKSYCDEDRKKIVEEYADLIAQATAKKASQQEKIQAYQKAADLILEKGSPLFDFNFSPILAERIQGRRVTTGSYPVIELKYGAKATFVPPITGEEQKRLHKNVPEPVHIYYHIYVAADLGWKAAALMPDNDNETAKYLNSLGSWLKYQDDTAADRFYQAIERRCAKTEIGKAAIKRHWFVPEDELPATEDPASNTQ